VNSCVSAGPESQWPLQDRGAGRSRISPTAHIGLVRLAVEGDFLDVTSVSAPTARDRINDAVNDARFFDGQLPTHGEVMKGPHR